MTKLLGAFALASVTSSAFALSYFNDFQATPGAEWSNTTTAAFNGTSILGRFGNGTVTLTLSGFGVGDAITIGFDFYALDSWDGNDTTFGPDRFRVSADTTSLLDTTFSNLTPYAQSYPDAYLAGSHPLQTGADDKDVDHGGTLPNGYYGNSLYKFGGALNGSFSTTATSSTMTFNFTASGLQDIGDESWGIDNVRIESVPEPTTLVAMVAGLGLAFRRRK